MPPAPRRAGLQAAKLDNVSTTRNNGVAHLDDQKRSLLIGVLLKMALAAKACRGAARGGRKAGNSSNTAQQLEDVYSGPLPESCSCVIL
jgi:hypothetical protein